MERTSVLIPAAGIHMEGTLTAPDQARGVVIFAHGSGSSRHSPRNVAVADALASDGRLATLLFDLLTPAEDAEYANRFDIALLADRLGAATDWAAANPRLRRLGIGYFGASTGAAAALLAASKRDDIGAVVSRGGRPDLAGSALAAVRAPTLLIVGGADTQVLALNREATAAMIAPVEIAIVPGATHLFEEPGALSLVARLAKDWFEQHLV